MSKNQVSVRARDQRLHVDGANLRPRTSHGARLDAELAPGAVLDGHLERVAQVGKPAAGQAARTQSLRARWPAMDRRSSARESWRAGTPSRSFRTGCTAPASRPTLSEMFRFSHRAVAAACAIHREGADWQLVAAPRDHHGGDLPDESGACAGTRGLARACSSPRPAARLHAGSRACDRRPRNCSRPVPFLCGVGRPDGILDCAMASSRGSTPEIAKKHVCMMVLIRPGMPARSPRGPRR